MPLHGYIFFNIFQELEIKFTDLQELYHAFYSAVVMIVTYLTYFNSFTAMFFS